MSTFPISPVNNEIVTVANVAYQYNSATNSWRRVIGNIVNLSVSGNVTTGNLQAAGAVSAVGNVTGNYILGNGALLTGVITSVANINNGTSNVTVVSSGGNVTVGIGGTSNVAEFSTTGVRVTGLVSATGTVTAGNLSTAGTVITGLVGSNLIPSANVTYSLGNTTNRWQDLWLSNSSIYLGNITLGATATALTVDGVPVVTSIANAISVAGNITGGNLLTAGNVSATGNVSGNNFIGNVVATTVSASGNIQGANLSAVGNVAGTYILGDGSYLTGLYGVVGQYLFANTVSSVSPYYQAVFVANYVAGTVATATQTVSNTPTLLASFLTNVGFPNQTYIPVGVINIAYETQKASGASTYTTYAEIYKRTSGGVETLLLTSDVTSTSALNTLIQQSVSATNSTVIPLDVTDRIAIKIYAQLLSGANASITLRWDDATSAGFDLPAPPTSITQFVPYNNPTANVDLDGYGIKAQYASAIGNITGGNILTDGLISATSTITSSANITGANLVTAGQVTATGNITGGNVLTAGLISVSGNATADNFLTAGQVSATGNVTAGNVNTTALRSGAGALTISTGSGAINLQPASGNIVLSANTYINNLAQPVQDQDAVTKIYVDNAVSTAISYHEPVTAATTTTLATTTGGTITYNNGSNGVGATLTTTGSFNLIDTANVQTANTRILVKNEANAVFNGVYVWTNATVITRSTDTNSYGAGNVSALGLNDYFFVTSGNVNAGSAWVVNAPTGTITFGTSNISFAQFSSSQTYTANTGAGLSLIGTVFNAKVDGVTTAFDGGGNISVKASANLTTPNIGAATGTSLSVTGNVEGGNLFTGGNISAAGNITGGGVRSTSSATAPASPAVGDIWFDTTSGVIYRFTFDGSSYFWEDISGGSLAASIATLANGNSNISVLANGNLTVGITGTSNVVVFSPTAVEVAGNILPAANATYDLGSATQQWKSLYVSNNTIFIGNVAISTSGNALAVNGNNVVVANATGTSTTAGNVSITGTVTGGNLSTPGLISATGNITGNYIIGNGSQLTGLPAGYSNTDAASFLAAFGSNTISTTGTVTAGNVTSSNILTGGIVSATGNVTGNFFIGNGSLLTGISAGGGLTWQNVVTGNTTVSSGNAYAVNTTSQAIVITLPATPGAGNTVQLTDYTNTWATNPVTVNRNGANISGGTANLQLNVNGATVQLTYIDATRGWISSNGYPIQPVGAYTVAYLVVAGGGGGSGGYASGGGGAGGLLTSSTTLTPGTAYSVTIGAGGAGRPGSGAPWDDLPGASGANSSIANVATTVGGGGGMGNAGGPGVAGGSGGGGASNAGGGAGTLGQGNPGGSGGVDPYYGGGGGGGAGQAGVNGTSTTGGNGGNGVSSSISGTATSYAGGGGGGTYYNQNTQSPQTPGTGGSGGGSPGTNSGASPAGAATVNSGGGGGGGGGYYDSISAAGGNGGSGIVIISYQGPQRGTGGAISTSGGNTIHTFLSSGTYTA